MKGKKIRAMVLKCQPDEETKDILDSLLVRVREFLEITEYEFTKLLYEKFRELDPTVHSRIPTAIAKELCKTVINQRVIPLDKQICRLKRIRGGWFIELTVFSRSSGRDKESRTINIPVCLSENSYYHFLLDRLGDDGKLPGDGRLIKIGDTYFAVIPVPLQPRFDATKPVVSIGVSLSIHGKHAATLYDPKQGFVKNMFYDVTSFWDKAWKIMRYISKLQSMGKKDEVKANHARITEIAKLAHGNFLAKLLKVADEYWENGYNVVFSLSDLSWLKQVDFNNNVMNFRKSRLLSWLKFEMMLDARDYLVYRVKGTRLRCHRCGAEGEVKRKEFRCQNCGLSNFNAELNAARNAAKVGWQRAEKKRIKMEKARN